MSSEKDKLLETVKNHIKVLWDDEDDSIVEHINGAKAQLEGLTGTKLDFDSPGLARSLLFDNVRYRYNNALEYFEENFHAEILRLILQEATGELDDD